MLRSLLFRHSPRAMRKAGLVSHQYHNRALEVSDIDPEELRASRDWAAAYRPDTIPFKAFEFTYSRSSGPGGQNVNKVNSKATMRVPLSTLSKFVPGIVMKEVEKSRYLAPNSQSLVIQSDSSRRQSENIDECHKKLHKVVTEAARKAIPGETSAEDRSKWEQRAKSADKLRISGKKRHSSKKAARKGGGRSNDGD